MDPRFGACSPAGLYIIPNGATTDVAIYAQWAVTNYAIYVMYVLERLQSPGSLIQVKKVYDREPYETHEYSVSFDVEKRELQWHLNGNARPVCTVEDAGEKDSSLHTIMEQPAGGGVFDDVEFEVREWRAQRMLCGFFLKENVSWSVASLYGFQCSLGETCAS